jgi:hypothetical protein
MVTAAAFLGAFALAGTCYAASSTDASAPAATPAAKSSSGKMSAVDHVEKRISELHAKLHITAAQETQWATVAQAMRDNAQNMDALIKDRSAQATKMTAVEDLVSYEKLAAAHEDGLKKFIPVFQTLYDGMSDAQKKSADAAFRGHAPHGKSIKS